MKEIMADQIPTLFRSQARMVGTKTATGQLDERSVL